MCLVCGYVGCSRQQYGYGTNLGHVPPGQNGHMLQHWGATQFRHKFAVELDTKFVWDYHRDMYVHRSEESSATQHEKNGGGSPDRKPGSTASASAFGDGDVGGLSDGTLDVFVSEAKQESIATEYVSLGHFSPFLFFWLGLCLPPHRGLFSGTTVVCPRHPL